MIYVWEPSEKRVLTGSGLESIRLEEKHKAVLVPASPQGEDEGRERTSSHNITETCWLMEEVGEEWRQQEPVYIYDMYIYII